MSDFESSHNDIVNQIKHHILNFNIINLEEFCITHNFHFDYRDDNLFYSEDDISYTQSEFIDNLILNIELNINDLPQFLKKIKTY